MKKLIFITLVSVGLMNVIGCCKPCGEKSGVCPMPPKVALAER